MGIEPGTPGPKPSTLSTRLSLRPTLVGFGSRHSTKGALLKSHLLYWVLAILVLANSLLMLHSTQQANFCTTPDRAPEGYLHHSWQGTWGVPAPLLTPDRHSVMKLRSSNSVLTCTTVCRLTQESLMVLFILVSWFLSGFLRSMLHFVRLKMHRFSYWIHMSHLSLYVIDQVVL